MILLLKLKFFLDRDIPLSLFVLSSFSFIFIFSDDDLYSFSKSNKKSLTVFSFLIASLRAFDNFSFLENNLSISISKLFNGSEISSLDFLFKLIWLFKKFSLLLLFMIFDWLGK